MADTNRQHRKLHLSLAEHCIPESSSELGAVWIAKDTKNVFYVTRSGVVANLTHILNSEPALAPMRQPKDGAAGKDGVCVCRQGIDGKDGRDGRDADILMPTDNELAAAVLALRAEKAKIKAAFVLELEAIIKLSTSNYKNLLLARISRLKADCGL